MRSIIAHVTTLVVVYLLSLCIIANSKDLQTFLVFLPSIKNPVANLTQLSNYGLDSIARNIETKTSDGNILRGWHIDNSKSSRSVPDCNKDQSRDSCFDYRLAHAKRIVVYFHGNAFTRGLSFRIEKMKNLSSRLDAHVIVFDYSGFADSSGYPSEVTALNDAHAILQYVNDTVTRNNINACGWYTEPNIQEKEHRNNQPQLYFYGHSLGTGISTSLLHDLASLGRRHNPISGLIMDSPFTSIPDVVGDHLLIKYFTPLKNYLKSLFSIRFPTLDRITKIGEVPLLIMHGTNDGTIPVDHSRQLYKKALLASSNGLKECTEEAQQCHKTTPIRYWEIPTANHNNVYAAEGWSEKISNFMNEVELL